MLKHNIIIVVILSLIILATSTDAANVDRDSKVAELIKQGETKAVNGDYVGAWNDYQKALELDPLNHEATFNMSALYVRKKQYKDALSWMLKADKMSPKHCYTQRGLGMIYFNLGENDKALKHYQKAVVLCDDEHDKKWVNYLKK